MNNNFREIKLKRNYTSLKDNLVKDLINPLLSRAKSYDRAVGFFSSSWLKEAADGLSVFASNGRKARIITSVKFSEEDWEAIEKGEKKELIEDIIDKEISHAIEELKKSLEKKTLATLSWLVAQGILEFRIARPIGRLKGGIFHTKLSLFYDEEANGIAVFGSQNDSHQANINEESLNVFTNWDFGKEYFEDHKKDFEEKWSGNGKTLVTYSVPKASQEKIIEVGKDYYPLIGKGDKDIKKEAEITNNEINNIITETDVAGEQIKHSGENLKALRKYQVEAIDNWINNNYSGLFEMATGSGKTFTAISAAVRIFEEKEKLFLIVLVPYQHLVEQWNDELRNFGFKPINCYSNKASWEAKAHHEVKLFNAGITNKVCLISTHVTACLKPFQKLVKNINEPFMLIADEVHGLGAREQRKSLFPNAIYRIGLSATPARWYDEEGTTVLNDYFKKTVITYDLKNAIDDGALTQYEYIPILVELTDGELDEYSEYTDKINKLSLIKDKTQDEQEILENLCRKRARLVGSAKGKLDALKNLVREHMREFENENKSYVHNLYYCCPGEHKLVLERLAKLGLKVHEFVHTVSKDDRIKVLKAFKEEDIAGLVAVKCLDEGVDVPATKRAYILASSTNPREFIQRRGRILRKIDGKDLAYIYDFIVGPWSKFGYEWSIAQSLLRRELPRFAEFNDCSCKKYSNIEKIYPVCEYFGMTNEIDKKPWEIYADTVRNYSDLLIVND